MVPQEVQAEEQPVFDYLVANVGRNLACRQTYTVKGSQFNQPLLEFSVLVQDVQRHLTLV